MSTKPLPFSKFIWIPIMIAALATIMMAVDIHLGSKKVYGGAVCTFIAFQAWAMYFMAGCNIKDGIRVLLGYIGGIAASIAIIELATLDVSVKYMGDYKFLIPVFLVVILVICAERVPMLDFVPAWFVSAGMYFAMTNFWGTGTESTFEFHQSIALAIIVSCIWGLIFGFVTVLLRGIYEKMVRSSN